jgi:adenine-specific DNA-methyltransferase
MAKKPPIQLETTTLWDYPSQSYGNRSYGDNSYPGVTPAAVIWNSLMRYTRPGDLVVDPMAGSGTALDVASELGREVKGFDLQPQRPDIEENDARNLPLATRSTDFVFIDPPYSTHIRYSGRDNCIGELHSGSAAYFEAMQKVFNELFRVLKDERFLTLYVADSYEHKKGFIPIGFELFNLLKQKFVPVDIITVKRYNAKLMRNHWHIEAISQNFFLRGFNYLFIFYKPRKGSAKIVERRPDSEIEAEINKRKKIHPA